MRARVRVSGGGTLTVSAYGVADAEHLLEKECARLPADVRLSIREVHRLGSRPRIVEDYALVYRLQLVVEVDDGAPDAMARAAYAAARESVRETRFDRIAWDRAEVLAG